MTSQLCFFFINYEFDLMLFRSYFQVNKSNENFNPDKKCFGDELNAGKKDIKC